VTHTERGVEITGQCADVMCVWEDVMDLHDEIRKLLSHRDRNDVILLIIASVIVLFWLLTASHLWG
jgi:hypothetical protein